MTVEGRFAASKPIVFGCWRSAVTTSYIWQAGGRLWFAVMLLTYAAFCNGARSVVCLPFLALAYFKATTSGKVCFDVSGLPHSATRWMTSRLVIPKPTEIAGWMPCFYTSPYPSPHRITLSSSCHVWLSSSKHLTIASKQQQTNGWVKHVFHKRTFAVSLWSLLRWCSALGTTLNGCSRHSWEDKL